LKTDGAEEATRQEKEKEKGKERKKEAFHQDESKSLNTKEQKERAKNVKQGKG